MEIKIKEQHSHYEFLLAGKMFVDDAAYLRNLILDGEKESQCQSYVFDLSNLTYIDSTGLGLLISIHKKALSNGGFFKIKGLNEDVRKLFELTRLHTIFDIE